MEMIKIPFYFLSVSDHGKVSECFIAFSKVSRYYPTLNLDKNLDYQYNKILPFDRHMFRG